MSFHFFFAKTDNFLLDRIPSIFSASTSRKLSSNASYAMRIRRASDDAELDVGFAGNSIDDNAIKDFGGYNLLGYTEDLTSTNWINSISGTGSNPVVTSGVSAPDGTNTAFNVKLDLNGGTTSSDRSDFLQYGSGDTIVGESYTMSVHLRSADGVAKDIVLINATGHSEVKNIGTSWAKYEFTKIETVANTIQFRLRLRGTQSDDNINLEVWHPQVEISSSSTEYQPRTTGGASDCFLTTLYDQSGNGNNATQTTDTNQPKIYDVLTGEVTKENGKPAMVFDGVDDNLAISGVAGNSNIDAYFVNRHDNTSTTSVDATKYLYFNGSSGSNNGFVAQDGNTSYGLYSNYGTPNLYKNNILLSPAHRDDIYHALGQTHNIVNHQGADISSWNDCIFGIYSSGSVLNFEGTLQEIIIFDKNLTTQERNLLHSDLNKEFNIY